MKRLWILRHAKSSWSDGHLDDHDRPLATRGERAADAVGEALAERKAQPQRILASTALRVRSTVERVQAQLPEELPVSFEASLYLASAQNWIDRLRSLNDARDVLVVGHNPGLEELVDALAPRGETEALRRLRKGMPTAALAEIELPFEDWDEIAPAVGRLVWSLRPKDLARMNKVSTSSKKKKKKRSTPGASKTKKHKEG